MGTYAGAPVHASVMHVYKKKYSKNPVPSFEATMYSLSEDLSLNDYKTVVIFFLSQKTGLKIKSFLFSSPPPKKKNCENQ